jgi:hypothetical protein
MIAWMECLLEATGIWIEVGLQVHVVSWLEFFRSKPVEELQCPPTGIEPVPRQSELAIIIFQTIHILKHDSAITSSLPELEFLHGQPDLLQDNLAGSSTCIVTPLYQ